MTQFDFENTLESIETPNQQDYSEDQEATCIALSCDKVADKKINL